VILSHFGKKRVCLIRYAIMASLVGNIILLIC